MEEAMSAGPIWKGAELATLGDLFGAVSRLETPEEGQEFMRVYVAHLASHGVEKPESAAFGNIGYLARYGSDETFERIQQMTGAQHPIFG
jgi:hypothetical protein